MKTLRANFDHLEEPDWWQNGTQTSSGRGRRMLMSLSITILTLVAATFISIVFRALGFSEANYILAYNLGVVLIAYLTDGLLYCLVASLVSMLAFNFFFTVPYYTLLSYSPDYPVTFISMVISASIASTLTSSVKRETRRAESRERRIRILYQHEKNLLQVNSKPQLLKVAAKDIAELFHTSVLIAAADMSGQLTMRHVVGVDIFQESQEAAAIQETFQSGMASGAGRELFPHCKGYYLPIVGANGILGVIGVAMPSYGVWADSPRLFLDALAGQISLALERERLYEKQQHAKLEIERERLRSDLLRSVSHDIRTPLTGMLGSVGTLIGGYDVLDDATRKDLLTDVYNETEWLSALVENVLSLTRLESQQVKLHRQPEAVEEIVASALSRVKRRMGSRTIATSLPNALLMVPMDATLIEQVLVNLLDNAIQHTPESTAIHVSVYAEKVTVVFEVRDQGTGLTPEALRSVFNRFYSQKIAKENRNGIGIGLSICKSIIEAHGGAISAENAAAGGAIFRFTLPREG